MFCCIMFLIILNNDSIKYSSIIQNIVNESINKIFNIVVNILLTLNSPIKITLLIPNDIY